MIEILENHFLYIITDVMEVTERVGSSSVGIATGYGLDRRVSIKGRGNYFSLPHSAQTGSGAHPSSSQMGTGRGILPV
jgi:hypothetical protein